jgi:peptidoglycan-associated lipoprotein
MFRRKLLVIPLLLMFVLAMAACTKQQQVETNTEPDVTTEPEPTMEKPVEKPVVEPEPQAERVPVLEDVFFDFDKAELSSSAKRKLENNARQLKDATSVTVTIEGHCDERGTNSYNMALGERRAKAAAGFLRSLGVSASSVKTVSYGEERPFDSGHSEAAWAKNRRAHFVINN